jgi:hypothetical protein
MYRLIRYILFIMIIWSICINSLAQDNPIKVELQANKKEYIYGEPVLLRTSVINTSENDYVLKEAGYQWGQDSFTMLVSYNGKDFVEIMTIVRSTGIKGPLIQHDDLQPNYVRNYIPKSLEGKQRVEITDLFIIPKPGEYKFKSILKDRYENVKPYESEPVSFKILPLSESEDSIYQLDDPRIMPVNLATTINFAHYRGIIGNRPQSNNPLGLEAFEKIASEIINNHKDSVFREYILYADIMAHGERESSYHPLPEKNKQEAYDFAKEYSDSWLLPFVYLKLGDTFIYEKDLDKAEEYIDKSYELAPNASFLGAAKGSEIINAVRQRTGNNVVSQVQTPPVPVTLPKKKPIGVTLPIAGAVVAVILIAGLFIFSRKKKLNKTK